MSTDNKPFCIIFSRKPISECFKKTWQVTICSRCEFEKSNKHSGNKRIITYGRFSNFSSTKYRLMITFLETVCKLKLLSGGDLYYHLDWKPSLFGNNKFVCQINWKPIPLALLQCFLLWSYIEAITCPNMINNIIIVMT